MKKLLFVLIALVSFTTNAHQGYEPIVKEGRQWVYSFHYKSQITEKLSCLPMVFEFKGDSIINGNTYKKCYRTIKGNDIAKGSNYGDYMITDAPMLVACCREYSINDNMFTLVTAIYSQEYKNEMIGYDYLTIPFDKYALPSDDSYEHIVYYLLGKDADEDFKAFERIYGVYGNPLSFFYLTDIPGMRLTVNENKWFLQWKTDSVTVGGEPRMRIGSWIESIGQTGSYGRAANFLSSAAEFRYLDPENANTVFSHFVENGNVVYKGNFYDPRVDFTSTSSVDNVNVTTLPSDDSYYNLQGQRVSEPQAGIYIHNGKKIVVK